MQRRSILIATSSLALATTLSFAATTAASATDIPVAPALSPTVGQPVWPTSPPTPPTTPPVEETKTLALTPAEIIVKPGESVTYQVTVLDREGGVPLDPQPELDYFFGTDDGSATVNGSTVTAGESSPGSAVFVRSGHQYGVATLIVLGAPVDLQVTPSATSVELGGSLTFSVSGVDKWGTPIDPADAVLTSSVATDVIDGQTVTFPTASPHTITATVDGVSTSVTIEVVAAAAAAASNGRGLAETGADAGFGGIAALLLGAGAIAVIAARRREAARG
ncbi:hypothetical protein [Agromyces sp. LHK192]|uniref:hypothetical protein n=1 Tax=Agromyces sp. LHK192 TaxID=2498704 RepID=UPI000FDABF7B|nr:hypothetical protein [Agromyces sp. LHK192]